MADETEYRIEHDTMGEVRVPASARWAAQTQRAVENFPVSGLTVDRRLVHALAALKAAAAEVNGDLGVIDAEEARAVAAAATEVADGSWDDQFPIDVYQTGSGTSTNMNANEVISSLASEALGRPVHPNDTVNASQSSNDTFPSAMHVAAAVGVRHRLLPALDHLEASFRRKADEFSALVKAGRTHLMDATPVTLGQEMAGYAAQVAAARARLAATLPRVGELPLGGTATGTGLNAPPTFASSVVALVAARLDVELVEAPDHFAAQGRATSWSPCRASCGPSPPGCSRRPTTCAGWPRGPRPAWPRSACRTSSPARRSCPAR